MTTLHPSFGHYEILGPIGAGGMGEVYAARDPRLGRKVAIKVLPQRLTGERDTLTRFTQEARSASALNHPNIVTIHEVGASNGSPYIVMEYIEGQDLRMLVARGPVPAGKVLDIASQIADGLAAAHDRGIVHRDLKPENIMLTRDGFVKILDFGLAKVVSPEGDPGDHTLELNLPGTNPGTILGTVGYMSPEQATGRPLDFRSDQFAFGAILYELVTGRPAFEGETSIDVLSAILHHDPPPVTKANARAPVQLAAIIRRLLAKAADDRYTSSRDLARELHTLRDRVVAEESGFHDAVRRQRSPAVAAVAVVALVAFIAGLFFITRERSPAANVAASASATASKKYLAILGFKAGDPAGQLVADGFTETLTARLARFPAVQVMRPPASSADISDIRKAARELGATLVLTGLMQRAGESIRVTYSVVDAVTGHQWTGLVDGTASNLFGVQDEVAEKVAANLELGATPAGVTLDPAVSQRRYLEALGLLQRYDNDESLDTAMNILQELGPSPTVQAALARAYLLKYERTRDPDFAAHGSDAAARALEADPQSLEVNVTLGQLRLQTGRYEEAIAAFVRVLSQQPQNADAILWLAKSYAAAGDHARAEQMYRRSIALRPNYWNTHHQVGAYYFSRGRYQDAIPYFRKVTQLIPDGESGYLNVGACYFALGRYEDAVALFQESVQRKATAHGLVNLGTTYYYLGRFNDAAVALDRAVQLKPHAFVYWRNVGDAYQRIRGREERARAAYTRAVELSNAALRVNVNDGEAHRTRAVALAKLGQHRGAHAAILRAFEAEPQRGSTAYDAAIVANVAGDEEEALARIEQAIRLGSKHHEVQRDPEFANLRNPGRLKTIIEASRPTPDN